MTSRLAYEHVLRRYLDRPQALDRLAANNLAQPSQQAPAGPDELIARHLEALDALSSDKFTPGGGHLAVRARLEVGLLHLEVVDDGRGIPAEGLAHLFEEFRQVKHASASREEGTGLGLAIVKSLVELHGGGLDVKSELDKGSTFGLWIPQPEGRP